MNETSTLNQLRDFDAQSPLASDDAAIRSQALRELTRGLEPGKPVRQKVADLLIVVMALSARTRRMVQPRVEIDVDVFSPSGTRAVRMYINNR
ncbi:hypothetical protein [Pelagibacterium lentulum]|uniref:Uncharacterized protein n=1 Tax=Pelagibacterium lentulum TaxID=2029865 RepID=A0A916RNR3_9HYPH|nr:hypothetical protein [Pelagibacterium lentulum]GGA60616.1 hypothetical protein GCM10011499_33590 [Pelagibacterium lentulum]